MIYISRLISSGCEFPYQEKLEIMPFNFDGDILHDKACRFAILYQ